MGRRTVLPKDLGVSVSARTQVDEYLAANGGRADSHALYTMWIGANDILIRLQPGSECTEW